jgi:hypothetical protein
MKKIALAIIAATMLANSANLSGIKYTCTDLHTCKPNEWAINVVNPVFLGSLVGIAGILAAKVTYFISHSPERQYNKAKNIYIKSLSEPFISIELKSYEDFTKYILSNIKSNLPLSTAIENLDSIRNKLIDAKELAETVYQKSKRNQVKYLTIESQILKQKIEMLLSTIINKINALKYSDLYNIELQLNQNIKLELLEKKLNDVQSELWMQSFRNTVNNILDKKECHTKCCS